MNFSEAGETIIQLSAGSHGRGRSCVDIETIEQLDYFLNLHNLRLVPLDSPSSMDEYNSLCLLINEDSFSIIMSKDGDNYSVYNHPKNTVEVVANSALKGSCFLVEKLDRDAKLDKISMTNLLSHNLVKLLSVSFICSLFLLIFPLLVILILVFSIEVKSSVNLSGFVTGGVILLTASYFFSRLKSNYIEVLNDKVQFLSKSFLLRVAFSQMEQGGNFNGASLWQLLNAKCANLRHGLLEHFTTFINELMMLLFALALFAYFSPSLFFIPLFYLICCSTFALYHKKKNDQLNSKKKRVKEESFLSQGKSLVALGLINPAIHFFTKAKCAEYNAYLLTSFERERVTNILNFFSMMCVVFVLGYAANGSMNQTVAATSFIASIILIWRIIASTQVLINLIPNLLQYYRDIELLNNEISDKSFHFSSLEQGKGVMRCQQCSFRYPQSKHNTLTNINIEIPYTAKLAISGAPLCGKTTLLKLLAGQLNAIHGSVSLNDTPVIECQKSVLLVSSSSFNLKLSLREAVNGATQLLPPGLIDRFSKRYEINPDVYFSQLNCQHKERYLLVLAILCEENIVLLDDILERHQPQQAEKFFTLLMQDCQQKTVIFSTQFRCLLAKSDNVCLLNAGGISTAGPAQKVLQQWQGGIK